MYYSTFIESKSESALQPLDNLLQGVFGLYELSQSFGTNESPSKKYQGEKISKPKIDTSIVNNVNIQVSSCKIIETYSDENQAGIKFKIKNNSVKTVYKLKVLVFYLDKTGNPFFEEDFVLCNSESWTGPVILKPNYSLLVPSSDNSYLIAKGMDMNEWDEGKVKVKIIELITINDKPK